MFSTVDFYGKDVPAEEKLPVKTDKDTLREGYRYVPLLVLFNYVLTLFIYTIGFDVFTVLLVNFKSSDFTFDYTLLIFFFHSVIA